jgi:hypothetical protein
MLRDEKDALLHDALMLLGLLHPSLEMTPLYGVLTSGTPEKRAEAIELLDNVLARPVKKGLLDYLEAPEARPVDDATASALLGALLRGKDSEWIVAGATYAVGRRVLPDAFPWVKAALAHPSEYVRETALDAFSRLTGPPELAEACQRLRDDPAARVRQLAVRLSATPSHPEVHP